MIKITKTENEWRSILNPEQFRVLRQRQTEKPFTGKYTNCKERGIYKCAGCGSPLFSSEAKFDSGCGWPAFYEALPGAVKTSSDTSMGMKRVEISCNNCEGHLGHVFKGEGFPTPTDERHCVNSVSLKLEKE